MTMNRIYLDNAASTPVDPEVAATVAETMEQCWGNASSMHSDGTRTREILEDSRQKMASFLGCSADEVFFTSGGTESNNWALKGFAFANRHKGNHIIVSAIEHECIMNTCLLLMTLGFRISYLPVDGTGIVRTEILPELITSETILISVMHVNNELGTIQPLSEIGSIARKHQVTFHSDACQSFGKIPLDPSGDNLSMISLNSHKIYGPKGVGALFIRKGTQIEPLLHGGGQERGLRSTTENIPGIAGFVKAATIIHEKQSEEMSRISMMKAKLISALQSFPGNCYFNGDPERNVPGIINFSLSGWEGEAIRILLLLDEAGISVSAGSACSNNHGEHAGSHVLRAIGRNPVEARGAIRVSTGRFNNMADIDNFIQILEQTIRKLTPNLLF